MSKSDSYFEYQLFTLTLVIAFYIENALKKSDWEVVAVDTDRNSLVLRRLISPKSGGV